MHPPSSAPAGSQGERTVTLLRDRFTGLWLHRDFRKLWAGHTISQIGSQVSFLALPLTAVLTLDATPVQMRILAAAQSLAAQCCCWVFRVPLAAGPSAVILLLLSSVWSLREHPSAANAG